MLFGMDGDVGEALSPEEIDANMPKLLGERVAGFDSDKRAKTLVRPLDGRPEGFEPAKS